MANRSIGLIKELLLKITFWITFRAEIWNVAISLNNHAAIFACFLGNETFCPESSISRKKLFTRERSRKSRGLLAFVGLAYIPITRIKTSVQRDMVVKNVRKSRSPFARVPHERDRGKQREEERAGKRERKRETTTKESTKGERKKVLYMGLPMPIPSLVSLASYHLCLFALPAGIVTTVRTQRTGHANPHNARTHARTHTRPHVRRPTHTTSAAVAVALYREHRSNL